MSKAELTATEFMNQYGLKKDTYSRYKSRVEQEQGRKLGEKRNGYVHLSTQEQKLLLAAIPAKLIKPAKPEIEAEILETTESKIIPVSSGNKEINLYINQPNTLTVTENSGLVNSVLAEQNSNLNALNQSLNQLFQAAKLQGKAIGQKLAVKTLESINEGYFETLNQGTNNLQNQVTQDI